MNCHASKWHYHHNFLLLHLLRFLRHLGPHQSLYITAARRIQSQEPSLSEHYPSLLQPHNPAHHNTIKNATTYHAITLSHLVSFPKPPSLHPQILHLHNYIGRPKIHHAGTRSANQLTSRFLLFFNPSISSSHHHHHYNPTSITTTIYFL